MTKEEYLVGWVSPVPSVTLKPYPLGSVVQHWGDSPELYSKHFGQNDDVHRFLGGHTGIDIAGVHRAPIIAAGEGSVVYVKTNRRDIGGLVIAIDSPMLDDHGNDIIIRTVYAHLDEMTVSVGDWVRKGQQIGFMGNTGFVISGSTPYWGDAPAGIGTHLHFSGYEFIYKDNAWRIRYNTALAGSFDPLPYLSPGELGGLTIVLNNARKLLQRWLERWKT